MNKHPSQGNFDSHHSPMSMNKYLLSGQASSFFKLGLMPKLDVEVLWKRQLICAHQRRAAAAAATASSAAAAARSAAATAATANNPLHDSYEESGASDGGGGYGYSEPDGDAGGGDYDEDGQGEPEFGGHGGDGEGWGEDSTEGGMSHLMSLTLDQLLQAPRKVTKIDINYNRSSRPVSVITSQGVLCPCLAGMGAVPPFWARHNRYDLLGKRDRECC